VQPISGPAATRRRRRARSAGEHGLTLSAAPRPSGSLSLFGNDRPLELEIGSGKGTFLLAESVARPDVNFLGIEYARRYWIFAADRLRRAGRANARVVLAEASAFVRDFLETASLDAVHIYFPDPWPKTRHRRRRLIQPAFLELLVPKLKPGARLAIATDHLDYFQQIAECVTRSPLVEVDFIGTRGALEREAVGSNFERKYLKEGRSIYKLAAAKPG
jgi:tRNA (guanine-N7-)-methyltransferase